MNSSHAFQTGIFYPAQLGVLNRVVAKLCRWYGFEAEGSDADVLSRRAVSLHSSGITNEEALFRKLRRMPLAKHAGHTRNVSISVG
ncbi:MULTISPECIES: hypothetical protein [unclassified Mesorhizobium]|uniref:hypothetical protein n=1 Tax=unclassified Mesorhizobium TaxID=325217 RepID=UPI003015372A